MRRSLLLLVISSLLILNWVGSSAQAHHPTYLFLQPPSTSAGYYQGYGQRVQASSYAYGWFGASRRSHDVRHFGYHRNFTQWSSR